MISKSPYDFANVSTNPKKLYGFNILPPPPDLPGYTTAPDVWTGNFLPANWPAVWTNSWKPQIQLAAAHGANIVRVCSGLTNVLSGVYYSQAQWEAQVSTILSEARALGLMVGLVLGNATARSPRDITTVSNYTRRDYKLLLAAEFAGFLSNFEDVIAYVEVGVQESGPTTESLALAEYAKSITAIPLLLSTGYGVNGPDPSFREVTYIDVLSTHWYPNSGGPAVGTDLAGVAAGLSAAMQRYDQIKIPLLIEETGIRGSTYRDKADWIQSLLSAAKYHPDCAGVMLWNGTSTNADGGGFQIYTNSGPDYGPSPSLWTDTVASRLFAAGAGPNRNLSFALTAQVGQIIRNTPTAIAVSASNGASVSARTSSNFTVPITLRQQVNARLRGVITAANTQPIALALVATSRGANTTIGLANVQPGAHNVPFDIRGTLGVTGEIHSYTLSIQALSHADAAFTSLAANLTIGNLKDDFPPTVAERRRTPARV
jgi:hypothetical protein